jgi:hypothetical protein
MSIQKNLKPTPYCQYFQKFLRQFKKKILRYLTKKFLRQFFLKKTTIQTWGFSGSFVDSSQNN